jgi:hypothetical protein
VRTTEALAALGVPQRGFRNRRRALAGLLPRPGRGFPIELGEEAIEELRPAVALAEFGVSLEVIHRATPLFFGSWLGDYLLISPGREARVTREKAIAAARSGQGVVIVRVR